MLKEVTGNICDATERMIIQGCNAQGVMGSGVAKAIRERWPQVYTEYYKDYERKLLLLGHVTFVHVDPNPVLPNLIIANIITQEKYGYDAKKYARYTALVKGLKKVGSVCERLKITAIATPPIGCGLGGLKKEFVFELLEECLTEYGISVTVYDLN